MAQLKSVIESIYTVLKSGSTNVYSVYEKIPVAEHEEIYAVAGVSKVTIENGVLGESGKYYYEKFALHIRILGRPNTSPSELYNMLDLQILDKLTSGGFAVNYAEISAPVQDSGLRRLILECFVEISGRTEVLNESQS